MEAASGANAVERLRRRALELSNLPTLPGVVQLVSTMVENRDTSAHDLASIISRDQVLSARILRMVNSPFYGFPGRISSVTHALVLLGFNVVKGLVLTTAVFENLAREAKPLWEHSLGVAFISRRLARELRMPDPDDFMVAGLLHDLGKVVLRHLAPDDYRRALELAQARRIHISQAEVEVFGVDHCTVAGWVAQKWHLPMRLQDSLVYHHCPSSSQQSAACTGVVHLADILARGMGYGDGGDLVVPPLEHEAFQRMGLTFQQIDTVLVGAEEDFNNAAAMFGGEGTR